MDTRIRELIRAQVKKSQDKLDAGRSLLHDGFFDDVMSRAYYSIFEKEDAELDIRKDYKVDI